MPLRRFAYERTLLVLIALVALPLVNVLNTQDVSRLALTHALLDDASVRIDAYADETVDRAFKDGHWYTEKAPGLSFLALPVVAALRAVDAVVGNEEPRPLWERDAHLWLIRLAGAGAFFALAVLLVGRVAEGLEPGLGAPAAVAFGLGTYFHPLATALFGHVTAGATAFAAFLLVSRGGARRLAVAGVLAGAAVLIEYQAALVAAALVAYALVRGGGRGAGAFLLGAAPAALVLGAYNTLAFGAPWRMSYRYVSNEYTEEQRQGLFGIGIPRGEAAWFVFLDGRGVLIVAPVLLVAAAGLWLLWRRGLRVEAAVCAGVSGAYLLANLGYFFPYGGQSPGPRFLVASLPFLCVGLAPAFRRWPWPSLVIAAWSIFAMEFNSITWSIANTLRLDEFPKTIWYVVLHVPRVAGTLLLLAPLAVAVSIAARELLQATVWRSASFQRRTPTSTPTLI